MKQFIIAILIIISSSGHAIQPDRQYIRYPQNMGLIYKVLDVRTPDNYKIETWYFPAQKMPDKNFGSNELLPYKIQDKKKRPTIIISNGDSGNMSYYQLILAMHYTASGYNVVTFDWRGFGTSSEFPMDHNYFCYTEMLTDYKAVITRVREEPETDSNNIYLLGWSTGGYLSMITAYNNPSIKGCILRGIPSSFEAIIPIIKNETGKKDENLLIPKDFPIGSMPLAIAPHFHKDIMLIVGSEDTRTPVSMSKEIFDKLPADIIKEIWIAHGAKHGGKYAPEFMYLNDFISNTTQFLQKSLSNNF